MSIYLPGTNLPETISSRGNSDVCSLKEPVLKLRRMRLVVPKDTGRPAVGDACLLPWRQPPCRLAARTQRHFRHRTGHDHVGQQTCDTTRRAPIT
jgi:hypothetical protein